MKNDLHALCVWKELALALYEDGVTTSTIENPGELLKQIAPERWERLMTKHINHLMRGKK